MLFFVELFEIFVILILGFMIQPLSHPSPHFKPLPIEVEFLILHYTAQDLESSLEIFSNPQSKVSCHLLIDPQGVLYELVPCWKGTCYQAFHAGKSTWTDSSHKTWSSFNRFSLGIELVNFNGNVFPYTNQQYETVFQTLFHLKSMYPSLQNPERILGHEHIAGFRNKSDPGYLWNWNLIFKKVYHCEKPTYLVPVLTKKQHLALSSIPPDLSNTLFKKISLILEKNFLPFFCKVLMIKGIVMFSSLRKRIQNQRGQMIIEYILLLVISVIMALALIKITDIGQDSPFFNFWSQITQAISEDTST